MDYLDTLMAKGAECREEIEKLRVELSVVETKLKLIEELVALEGDRKPVSRGLQEDHAGDVTRNDPKRKEPAKSAASGKTSRISRGAHRKGDDGKTPGQRIVDFCVEAIKTSQRPLSSPELVKALQHAGVKLPTETPRPYLSSMLSRAKKSVVNVRGRGYAVSGM